ncbi:MAG: HPP family protein [Candidatus Sedimenticola sp. 6PFRAG7]
MDRQRFEELAKKQAQPQPPRGAATPQSSLLYRLVAFFTQMQLGYLLRDTKHSKLAVRIFVFIEGLAALAIISTAAFLAKLPLLFPPLGPSAFILFRTPLSRAAAPRSVFLAHNMAMVIGIVMLNLFAFLYPEADLHGSDALNWPRIFALSLAMGFTSLGMIMFNCAHPPAAATTLIAAMGYFSTPLQIAALPVAVALLLLQAFIFNRLLGGLPFPVWSFDPKAAREYPDLAGLGDQKTGHWEQISGRVFERRKK